MKPLYNTNTIRTKIISRLLRCPYYKIMCIHTKLGLRQVSRLSKASLFQRCLLREVQVSIGEGTHLWVSHKNQSLTTKPEGKDQHTSEPTCTWEWYHMRGCTLENDTTWEVAHFGMIPHERLHTWEWYHMRGCTLENDTTWEVAYFHCGDHFDYVMLMWEEMSGSPCIHMFRRSLGTRLTI